MTDSELVTKSGSPRFDEPIQPQIVLPDFVDNGSPPLPSSLASYPICMTREQAIKLRSAAELGASLAYPDEAMVVLQPLLQAIQFVSGVDDRCYECDENGGDGQMSDDDSRRRLKELEKQVKKQRYDDSDGDNRKFDKRLRETVNREDGSGDCRLCYALKMYYSALLDDIADQNEDELSLSRRSNRLLRNRALTRFRFNALTLALGFIADLAVREAASSESLRDRMACYAFDRMRGRDLSFQVFANALNGFDSESFPERVVINEAKDTQDEEQNYAQFLAIFAVAQSVSVDEAEDSCNCDCDEGVDCTDILSVSGDSLPRGVVIRYGRFTPGLGIQGVRIACQDVPNVASSLGGLALESFCRTPTTFARFMWVSIRYNPPCPVSCFGTQVILPPGGFGGSIRRAFGIRTAGMAERTILPYFSDPTAGSSCEAIPGMDGYLARRGDFNADPPLATSLELIVFDPDDVGMEGYRTISWTGNPPTG